MNSEYGGYVYVLSNPAMPGLVKIGRSKHSGRVRAQEIYKQGGTGVPMPFKMEFEIWSEDCVSDELYIHEELTHIRVNSGREFFNLDVNDAIKFVANVVLAGHNLCAKNPDLIVDECEVNNYLTPDVRSAIEEFIPDFPYHLTLARALADELSSNAVIEAVKKYKASCDKRMADLKSSRPAK